MTATTPEYRHSHGHIWWRDGYLRRCAKLGLTPVVEPFTRTDLVDRHGGQCVYCTGTFECTDHVIAVAAGGPHTLANVVPSCRPCNVSKLHAIDFPLIRLVRSGLGLLDALEVVAV